MAQKPTKETISDLLKTMELYIETDKSVEETIELCRSFEPWRVVYEFSNGVRTDQFEQSDFVYNPRPLGKLKKFHEKLDLSQFAGADVLDIGFNEGYHTIFMSKYLGCHVDAIELMPAGIERVGKLADFCGVSPNLMTADANTYVKEDAYDLIIHCGTLYHLFDVWSAMKNASNSLRKNGYLLMEPTTYEGEREYDCHFMNYHRKGQHNFWALSKPTIRYIFGEFGLHHVADVADYDVKSLVGTGMKRSLQIYHKS